MNAVKSLGIMIRYLFLLIIGLPGLSIFYFIFTSLTIYPSFAILSLIHPSISLVNSVIALGNHAIAIIPACIAGSAYYFLLILNLTTPMSVKMREKSILFLFVSFLVLNILRITLFASLFLSGFEYFDFTHKFAWYFGSSALVVLLWFVNVRLFRIKEVPVYSDFKFLYNLSRKS